MEIIGGREGRGRKFASHASFLEGICFVRLTGGREEDAVNGVGDDDDDGGGDGSV